LKTTIDSNANPSIQDNPSLEEQNHNPQGTIRGGHREKLVRLRFSPHTFQQNFLRSQSRFKTYIAGFRGGKTAVGSIETFRESINWGERVRAEKLAQVLGLVVAPTYPMLRDVSLRAVNEWWPSEFIKRWRPSEMRMECMNGVDILFRAGEDDRKIAGLSKVAFAWLDEASLIPADTMRMVRARLMDLQGNMWATTTPRGMDWVYEYHLRGEDPGEPDYFTIRHSSDENPFVPFDEIEEYRRTMPARWVAQNIDAEFIQDGSGIFFVTEDNFLPELIPFNSNEPSFWGLDLARLHDFTVLIGIDTDKRVRYFGRKNLIRWKDQKDWIIKTVLSAGPNFRITVDSTGVGDPIVEDLQDVLGKSRVEGFSFANAERKIALIDSHALSIEQNEFRWPIELKIMTGEYRAYTYIINPQTRRVKYGAPEGQYDDCPTAGALADKSHREHYAKKPIIYIGKNQIGLPRIAG